VQAAISSCTKGATADHPEVPAEKIATYCTCSANAVADVTTMADVEYINSHGGTPSEDYQKRMKTVAIACNAKRACTKARTRRGCGPFSLPAGRFPPWNDDPIRVAGDCQNSPAGLAGAPLS